MPAEPLGVILAGGLSRRMGGGDKGLLPLGRTSILGHVVERLRPQVADLALNANGDPARFPDFGVPVLPDEDDDRPGPLGGVLAGLDWAASCGAAAIVTAAADTPFLPRDLVARLIAAAGPSGIALAATREDGRPIRHPTFGLWPVALREDLRAALADGDRKVVIWTDRHDAGTAMFDDPAPFFNVNTPDDLEVAREMLADAR
jgi:molybdopterin-guanine dinucleotide biosynthesis protein A